ncbi:MAG: tetratricopeptide repeat protein [Phycisphaerae bacterium]|nr:tetratricopeptide repeat protein [Phycisphaerae bacterium]
MTDLGRPRRTASRWRIWAFRLAAMLLIPAMLFGSIEVGLRLGGAGYDPSFFVPLGGGKSVYGNPRVGWRYFPRSVARLPTPFVMDARKQRGAYRIFVLGSSAAQGFPDSTFSFARILDAMLCDAFPTARFEVINTAMVAVNSHVVLQIARDCAEFEPDTFIIYEGNNEVVGPFGPGTVFRDFSDRLWAIRTNLALARLRLVQVAGHGMSLLRASDETGMEWKGMEFFLDRPVAATDSRLDAVYHHFERNLKDICRTGRDAGARVLLCTVGVNLRDCAPFASQHREDLTPDDLAEWNATYADGVRLAERGDFAAAIDRYQAAAKIDDQHAELHYRIARCQSALNLRQPANQHYAIARNLDVLRFRTDQNENETIRRVVSSQDGGVRLVDVERYMALNDPAGLGAPGKELFHEHCHMTFLGNYEIARLLFDALLPGLPESIRKLSTGEAKPCSIDRVMERLAFTPYAEETSLKAISGLLNKPPFSAAMDVEEHRERVERRLNELASLQTPESFKTYCDTFDRALAIDPNDPLVRANYAELLMAGDRFAEAEQNLREALKAFPFDAAIAANLGRAVARQGRNADAESLLRAAAGLDYCDDACQANTLFNLGILAHQSGRLDEARALYLSALKFRPARSDVRTNLGQILLSQGDSDAAIREFTAAAAREPRNPTYRLNLASALAYLLRTDDAIAALTQASRDFPTDVNVNAALIDYLLRTDKNEQARIHAELAIAKLPDSAEIRYKAALVMQKLGRRQEAIDQLGEALRLSPGHQRAQAMLETLEKQSG